MDKGEKVDYRYYPGIYLIKSAKTAYAEVKVHYDTYDTPMTPLRQRWIIENDSCSNITTATTEKLLSEVIGEIESMYEFIESCKDPQDISFDKYCETSVVSVVAVVKGQEIPVSPMTAKNVPVVEKSPVVDDEPRGIEAELQQAEDRAKAKRSTIKSR